MKKTINVTKGNIAKGLFAVSNGNLCPIALALKRVFKGLLKEGTSVYVHTFGIRYAHPRLKMQIVNVPGNFRMWQVNAFNGNPKPFSFETTIPKRFLA